MFEMKRKAKEETETPFIKNGRMLLEELIAFCNVIRGAQKSNI